MTRRIPQYTPRHPVRRGFVLAILIGVVVFYVHTHALFLIGANLGVLDLWLSEHLGRDAAGRAIIVLVFLVLFVVHILEAAVWGVYLRFKGLFPALTEGIYFAATSITGLGYGDLVLPPPWRLLGPIITITGVLMFGCSTAFLFLILQRVWGQLL